MKIRILGNSLRFRLGRSEVTDFGIHGSIESCVSFGAPPQSALCYRLEKSSGVDFSGSFLNGTITVGIPETLADEWVKGDKISIAGSQKVDGTTELRFLIEKDFVCLNAHNDEDQSDRYPHPKGDETC